MWRLMFLLAFNAPYTKIATMHFTFDQESCLNYILVILHSFNLFKMK